MDEDDEIDELLSKAIDPFIEYDDPQDVIDSDSQITKFLKDFNELQAQQIEFEQANLKKIRSDQHEHHMAEHQHGNQEEKKRDSDDEEEESQPSGETKVEETIDTSSV